MSNYGASGSGPVPGPGPNGLAPFDDLDLLQGRRQQQQQGLHSGNLTVGGNTSAIPGGMAGARGRPPDFSQHHLNLLQHQQQHHHDPSAAAANSPFSYSNNNNSNTVGVRGGGAPGHHLHASPYTRMTNPYAAIADVRAAAAYGGGGMGPSGTPQGATASADAVAQLYAAQQRRAQLTNSYGYNNSAAGVVGGGGGGAPASRQALEHHYAAYGNMAGGTPLPGLYGHEYGHDLSYSAQSAAHDASLQQQQQHHHHHNHQQQMQDAYGHSMPKPPMSYHSPDGTGGGETMMGHDPSSSQHSMERYHHHGGTNSRKQHKLSSRSSPGSNRSKDGKQRKPMLQKVTSTINKAKSSSRVLVKDGVTVIEDGNNTWYTGCIPLGVEDDKYWLSELQVFLRSNFAEAFGATEEDIAAPMHGRNKPIALGQVGIRCLHCKDDNPAERGQQATSYPSLISGIYNSVQQMLRLHLDCCLSMPPEVRAKIEALKVSCSSRGGRKQYWVDSAKRLGLVDTAHGIHFGRDPQGPLPPLSGPSVNSKEGRVKKRNPPKPPPPPKMAEPEPAEPEEPPPPPPPVDCRPLVFPEDEALISDYLYLTLEQMSPCLLMEADRVGCYKARKVGFPGLACRHCVGQAGCGRYFPASEASLSQTTTSQTIMNHVRNCRRCPIEIRENLDIMKRNRMGHDGKRNDKPKHGGRKVFFHRLWCRIQNLPFDDSIVEMSEKKRKYKKPGPKKRRKTSDGSEEDSDEDGSDDEDEETDSEEDNELSEDELDSKPRAKKIALSPVHKAKIAPWVEGCVRLTKADDIHWLSEMECFARIDLIEAFSVTEDELPMYAGRKEPALGQVGVRCIFCKTRNPSERPNNFVSFPETLSTLHTKITDLIRFHFPNCPAISSEAKATFKSHKGFDAKVANEDSQQYWVDAARDVGLSNVPPEGSDVPGAWGITFRRDPVEPSPADELDLEQVSGPAGDLDSNFIILEEDRGECTDRVMLLLRQVQPCQFRKSDRRAGPGARGRDRSMGFPGLCCLHCAGKSTLGRYFPVTPKNLTDSAMNSMQSHIGTCPYCPEPIKASLAYLSHRSILQKAELSGSWKKAFFKKIWDRLHVERAWTSIDDEEKEKADNDSEEEEELDLDVDDDLEEEEEEDDEDDGDEDGNEGGDGDGSEGEDGEGNQMNALIKAAAIWLTNQDAATDGKGRARSAKERPLPGKRGAAAATPSKADVASPTTTEDSSSRKRKGRK